MRRRDCVKKGQDDKLCYAGVSRVVTERGPGTSAMRAGLRGGRGGGEASFWRFLRRRGNGFEFERDRDWDWDWDWDMATVNTATS